MNFLDLAIFLILAGNMLLGFWFGVMRRALVFAGLFAGVGAATLTSAQASGSVASTFNIDSALWAHVLTYAGIVVFAIVLFEILGAAYERWISALISPLFDRMAGVLAGAILGAVEVTLLLILGVGLVNASLPPGYASPPAFGTMQQLFYGSFLAPHFYGLEPLTRSLFAMVLPSNVGPYFTQLLAR